MAEDIIMRGFFNTVVAMALSLAMLIGCMPLTALAEGEKMAQITIKYRDEENNEIRADKVIKETYSEGGTYTLPDSLKADFAVKTASGSYNLYKFNAGKSDLSASFADHMTLTLVFNNTDSYAFYEDFADGSVDFSLCGKDNATGMMTGSGIGANTEKNLTLNMTAGHTYVLYTYQNSSTIAEMLYSGMIGLPQLHTVTFNYGDTAIYGGYCHK